MSFILQHNDHCELSATHQTKGFPNLAIDFLEQRRDWRVRENRIVFLGVRMKDLVVLDATRSAAPCAIRRSPIRGLSPSIFRIWSTVSIPVSFFSYPFLSFEYPLTYTLLPQTPSPTLPSHASNHVSHPHHLLRLLLHPAPSRPHTLSAPMGPGRVRPTDQHVCNTARSRMPAVQERAGVCGSFGGRLRWDGGR